MIIRVCLCSIILPTLLMLSALSLEQCPDKRDSDRLISIFNDDRFSENPYYKYGPPECNRLLAYDALAIAVDVSEYSKYELMFPLCGVKIDCEVNTDFDGTIDALKIHKVKRLCVLNYINERKLRKIIVLNNLTHLYINCHWLSDEILELIESMTGLKHLFIKLSDRSGMFNIKRLKNINSITISQRFMSTHVIDSIAESNTLESVHLFGHTFYGQVDKLMKMETLRHITLSFNEIDREIIYTLSQPKHLESIAIYAKRIDIADLENISKHNFHAIRVGCVYGDITEFCESLCINNSVRILAIRAAEKDNITDKALEYLSNIELIDLECNYITEFRLKYIMKISGLKRCFVDCLDEFSDNDDEVNVYPSLDYLSMQGKYSLRMMHSAIECCASATTIILDGHVDRRAMKVLNNCVLLRRLFIKSDDLWLYSNMLFSKPLDVLEIMGEGFCDVAVGRMNPAKGTKVIRIMSVERYKYRTVVDLLERTDAYCMFGYLDFRMVDHESIEKHYANRCFPQSENIYIKYLHMANYARMVNYASDIIRLSASGNSMFPSGGMFKESVSKIRTVRFIMWEYEGSDKWMIIMLYKGVGNRMFAYYVDEKLILMEAEMSESQMERIREYVLDDRCMRSVALCRIEFVKFSIVPEYYIDEYAYLKEY